MKKGFTLVEMLAVVLILGVILLIGVPIYQGVRGSTNSSIYESKLANVKAKAEEYSSTHGELIYDIRYMIELGLLTPDNEAGEFIDPRDGRDMKCDVVTVDLEGGQYYAEVTEKNPKTDDDACIPLEELRRNNSIIKITLYDSPYDDANVLDSPWIKATDVYAGYNIPDIDDGSLFEAEWSGIANPDDIVGGRLHISATSILYTTVFLSSKFVHNNQLYKQVSTKNVHIDNEAPTTTKTVIPTEERVLNNKTIGWSLSDGEGSGIAGHVVLQTNNINEITCVDKLIPDDDSIIISKQVNNGLYYVCAKDNVGNVTTDKNAREQAINVTGIDVEGPKDLRVGVISAAPNYQSLDVLLTIVLAERDVSGYKMCISNTGFLENCEWEDYPQNPVVNKKWKFLGTLDGKERKVYVSMKDGAGNISSNTANYVVYKECSSTFDRVTHEGTCSKKCGTGKRTEIYDVYDFITKKKCETDKKRELTCNTQNCCESGHIQFKNGTTCTSSCGGGTYNQVAYSSYDSSIRCSSFDKTSGGSACNTQDCCSKVNYSDGTTCSKSCGGGTYNRIARSSYDNRRCPSQDLSSGGSSCNVQSCCSKVNYSDGTTCSRHCGNGTYNRLAYSAYDGSRCSGNDLSSGGSSCRIRSCSSESDRDETTDNYRTYSGGSYSDCHGAGCWM